MKKIFCKICGKQKPPIDFSLWSTECDATYSFSHPDFKGKRYPGFCDSKRLGLPWPPFKKKKGTEPFSV